MNMSKESKGELALDNSLSKDALRGKSLVKIKNHKDGELTEYELAKITKFTLAVISNGSMHSMINNHQTVTLWYSEKLEKYKVLLARKNMAPYENGYSEIASIKFADKLYESTHLKTQDITDISIYLKELLNHYKEKT